MKAIVHIGFRKTREEYNGICKIIADCMRFGNQFLFNQTKYSVLDSLESGAFYDLGVELEEPFLYPKTKIGYIDMRKDGIVSRAFIKDLYSVDKNGYWDYAYKHEDMKKLIPYNGEENVKCAHVFMTDLDKLNPINFLPPLESLDELHIHYLSDYIPEFHSHAFYVLQMLMSADEIEYRYRNALKNDEWFGLVGGIADGKISIGDIDICRKCEKTSKYWNKTFKKNENLFCYKHICRDGVALRLPNGKFLMFVSKGCKYKFEHEFATLNNEGIDEKKTIEEVNDLIDKEIAW